jgi:hypothetical protein
MKLNRQILEDQLNDYTPPASNIGYVLLISNNTTTESFTTNFAANSDRISIADNTLYGNGARVRFSTTNTLPDPLSTGVDYWVRPDSGDSTKLQVYDSYDNYVANNPIVLTSNGVGTHTTVEQEFNEALFLDGVIPLTALANKEVNHVDYSRLVYNYPTVLWDSAEKEAYGTATFTYARDPGNPTLNFRFVVLILGGSSISFDTSGALYALHDFVTPQVITTAQAINLRITARG